MICKPREVLSKLAALSGDYRIGVEMARGLSGCILNFDFPPADVDEIERRCLELERAGIDVMTRKRL